MEQAVLSDKSVRPTEEIIYAYIGKSRVLWDSLFEYLHAAHPDVTAEWRYYMDGKRWLLKACRKTKTIFWLSLFEDSFRTTFYFTDKAADAIATSGLSRGLKAQFDEGKKYNKIRGITILYKVKRDLDDARRLIELKTSLK